MNQFIIYNPATKLFDFFINSLDIEINKHNINTIIINDIEIQHLNYNFNYDKDIILIVINPHFIFDYKEINNEINEISKKFKFKILYLSEPINFIVESKIYQDLIKIIKPYCLWTYTKYNFQKINTYLKIFKIFPTYNEYYHFTDINNIKERNTDKIIFFGNINENRLNICNQLEDVLINKKESWTKKEWIDILNENLFYLNIHRRNNCKSCELFRITPILANGGIIFSERCNEEEEKEYSQYNIIFCEKNKLYEIFLEYKNKINVLYDNVYNKTMLYRNNMIKKNNLNDYLEFHNKLI